MHSSGFPIILARDYVSLLREEQIRRAAYRSPRPPRRRLRRLLGGALRSAGRGLARLGDRLLGEAAARPLPLGCG